MEGEDGIIPPEDSPEFQEALQSCSGDQDATKELFKYERERNRFYLREVKRLEGALDALHAGQIDRVMKLLVAYVLKLGNPDGPIKHTSETTIPCLRAIAELQGQSLD